MIKNKLFNNNGITLIALIITIVVILIIAGITIVQLTENGIFNKTKKATTDSKLKEYYEKVEFEFGTARLDYYGNKNQSFSNILEGILNQKDWIESVDSEINENENVIMMVETKDDYLILINIDNSIPKATIDYSESGKANYNATIIYNANGGEGTMDSQPAVIGKTTILKQNKFTKEGYAFIGWSTSTNEEDKIENNKIKLGKNENEKTVYAMWTEAYKITFNANEGTGEMSSISIIKGETGTLPTNTFTKDGWYFLEWNTVSDGSGTAYRNTGSITPEDNIILYAQWTNEKILKGESLLKIVEENTLVDDECCVAIANDEIYRIHTYNVPGNKTVNTAEIYGDVNDVSSGANQKAKRMVILKVNGNLTIESTGSITAFTNSTGYGGPKGMLIYCTGTITNNGKISMTACGARADGQDVYLWKNGEGNYEYIPKYGGLGGESVTFARNGDWANRSGLPGNMSVIARGTGGGGSGGTRACYATAISGAGGTGTSYSGGGGRRSCWCQRWKTKSWGFPILYWWKWSI